MKRVTLFFNLLVMTFCLASCSKSTDLRLFELDGDVKSCKITHTSFVTSDGIMTAKSTRCDGIECNFGRSHKLKSVYYKEKELSFYRDKEGNIVSIELQWEPDNGDWDYGDRSLTEVYSYRWSEDNFPIEYGCHVFNSNLEYNKDNMSMTSKRVCYNLGGEETIFIHRFKVLDKDEYGNWIKRLVEISRDGWGPVYSLEERDIKYY